MDEEEGELGTAGSQHDTQFPHASLGLEQVLMEDIIIEEVVCCDCESLEEETASMRGPWWCHAALGILLGFVPARLSRRLCFSSLRSIMSCSPISYPFGPIVGLAVMFCLFDLRARRPPVGFVTRVFYPPTFQIIKTWDSGVLQAAPRERAGRKKIRGIHHQVENTHTKKRIETHSGSEGGCSKVVTTKNTP